MSTELGPLNVTVEAPPPEPTAPGIDEDLQDFDAETVATIVVNTLPDGRPQYVVENDAQYTAAGEFIRDRLKPYEKAIEDFFAPIEKPLKDALDACRKAKNKRLDRLAALVKSIGAAQLTYSNAQKEKRRLAQLEADRIARQQEEQQRLAAAQQLQDSGDPEAAELLVAGPSTVVTAPPVVAHTVPKVAGQSETTYYSAAVDDKERFLRWVLQGGAARMHFIEPNMTPLNARARADKDAFDVPGCRLVKKDGMRTGPKR